MGHCLDHHSHQTECTGLELGVGDHDFTLLW